MFTKSTLLVVTIAASALLHAVAFSSEVPSPAQTAPTLSSGKVLEAVVTGKRHPKFRKPLTTAARTTTP